MPDTKICTKCKIKKPISEYHDDNSKRRKYSSCKECHNKYMQGYSKRLGRRKNIVIPKEKFCSSCGITKLSSEFSPNKGNLDGLFCWCKNCASDKRYEKKSKQTRGYLKAKYGGIPCTDCRVSFPWECMDFDHNEGIDKSFNVCMYKGTTQVTTEIIKKLEAEIVGCEIVCSNCHRIRTTSRLNKAREERQTVRDAYSIRKQDAKPQG